MDNAHVESLNSRLRDECLNVNQFLSVDDARAKVCFPVVSKRNQRHYAQFIKSGLTHLKGTLNAIKKTTAFRNAGGSLWLALVSC